VRALIGGVQFRATIDNESKILNSEPLRFAGVDHIARLKDLTAYAVHFGTWFRYGETDRRQTGLPLVQEVVIEIDNRVDNTFPKTGANRPGVVLE
jgi:hypothetical protein